MDINEFNNLKVGDLLHDDRSSYRNEFIIVNINKGIFTVKFTKMKGSPSTSNMTLAFGKDMILKFKKINNYIEEDE